jgi:hypothetical protein
VPDARSPIRHHLVLYRRGPEQGRARFFSLMIERDLLVLSAWSETGSGGIQRQGEGRPHCLRSPSQRGFRGLD